MKKIKIFGIFLALVLMISGVLWAQAVSAKSASLSKVETYDELVAAIRGARAESRTRVEKAVEQERVREAWEIGRLIDAHVLQHKERAEYDKQVIPRLAKDLGSSTTELYFMLKFAREYPILSTSTELTWSDYRELLSLKDAAKRAEVSEKAAREHWDVKKIRSEVKRINQAALTGVEPVQRLTAQPGIPFTYRVVPGVEKGELALDLGFSNYLSLSSVILKPKAEESKKRDPSLRSGGAQDDTFKEGDIVQYVSPLNKGGKGDLKISSNPSLQKRGTETDLYTYEIKVLDVIDGDTTKAVIDLGFGFRTVQTLRLRGIDAPEIATADGMEAKKFLESVIANPVRVKQSQGEKIAASSRQPTELLAMTKPQILIKTVKSEKYDRYLADIFSNGVYVNQKLLDEGYAVQVGE